MICFGSSAGVALSNMYPEASLRKKFGMKIQEKRKTNGSM
jgi:hypothetical protein